MVFSDFEPSGYFDALFSHTKELSLERKERAYSQSGARIHKDVRDRVLKHVAGGARVLEVGCGWGFDGHQLIEESDGHIDYTGIDGSETTIAHARERFGLNALVGSGNTLEQLEDESFDVVFSVDVLEHLQNPIAHVANVNRVLKPGGYYVFDYPNRFMYPRPFLPSLHFLKNKRFTLQTKFRGHALTFLSHPSFLFMHEMEAIVKALNFEFIEVQGNSRWIKRFSSSWLAVVRKKDGRLIDIDHNTAR
jgi:2-polyprenyl-3-methyl-5-hydroxy-6-metoxy-1,4-benzoquinol methylase